MRLFLASSCTLHAEALALRVQLEALGHIVLMPCDPDGKSEFGIHLWNATLIEQADVTLALWNGISDGCYGDVAMSIALGKPVYVKLICSKRLARRKKPHPADMHMRRSWDLFGELATVEDWMDSQE